MSINGFTRSTCRYSLFVAVCLHHLPPHLLNNANAIRSKCYKYVKALLIPYFLLVLSVYAIDCLAGENLSTGGMLRILTGTPSGHAGSMWFVFAMFWVKVLDSVAGAYSKRWLLLAVSIVFMITFQIKGDAFLPRIFFFPFVAYPFFYFGLRMRAKIMAVDDKRQATWVICIYAISPFVVAGLFPEADMYRLKFCGNVVAYYVLGIMGTLMVLFACKRWLNRDNDVVQTLSKGSILILAFHKLVLWLIPYRDNVILVHLTAIATLLLFYYPIKAAQRYVPVIVGGRK